MSIALTAVPCPHTGRHLPVFANWELAARHVCDHVLSHPESEGWALLLPGERFPLESQRVRRRVAERAWAPGDEGAALQELYEAYAAEARAAVEDGARLGWELVGYLGRDREAFGTNGVLVILGPEAVRSVMLPGHGDPSRVVARRTDERPRSQEPIPRDDGGTGGRAPETRRAPRGTEEDDETEHSPRRNRVDASAGGEPGTPEGEQFRLFRRCARHVVDRWLDALWATPATGGGTLDVARRSYPDWHSLRGARGGSS